MHKLINQIIVIAVLTSSASGCSTIASSTNMLTDQRIKAETSGALGLEPAQVTILKRRTEGTSTYVNLLASNNQEYTCVIDGGDLLTMGMTNAPQCSKKGDPIPVNRLSR
jgi:hypothetical protein